MVMTPNTTGTASSSRRVSQRVMCFSPRVAHPPRVSELVRHWARNPSSRLERHVLEEVVAGRAGVEALQFLGVRVDGGGVVERHVRCLVEDDLLHPVVRL